ncbi:methyl-accepting chemotaxis protein [Vibrio chagasii]|nr:methyl-accepting chemotaxis protein [Vibrio chagasii]
MQAAQEAQSGNQTFDTVNPRYCEGLSQGIQEVSDVINTVGEKTSSNTVLDVIKGHCTDQTNLLALNAPALKLRGSEQGRGFFAVVADEVRNLANELNRAPTRSRGDYFTST